MKKIYIVGLGPGDSEQITPKAYSALAESDVIIGYDTYVALIKEEFAHKNFCSTGMRKEVQRCQLAVEKALSGQTVAMISSGDAGIYGMAGLLYEVAANMKAEIAIEVIAGVTAAASGAALLGAPLMHDFAVVSLSDLLTPMALIEKRLHLAADGDFVICLYNPSSKKRSDYLARACDIILQYRSPETVCGIAHHIGREGEGTIILSLAQLKTAKVDMFATVFIGNSQTKIINGKMVTPRGYDDV